MSNIFSDALYLLNKIGANSNISEQSLSYMQFPEHLLCVNFPVTMDDGTIRYFTGYRSRYSTALGPAKGGIRFHQEVDENLVNALALWMTLKTSLVGLPYGGGKGGVTVNPYELSKSELERVSRAYLKAIYKSIGKHLDIPASDIGTNQIVMAYMADEYERIMGEKVPGIITGKPISAGGSYFRKNATGYGVFYIIEKTLEKLNKDASNTSISLQGLGNVGYFTLYYLNQKGYKVNSISDHTLAIHNPNGIDVTNILPLVAEGKTLSQIKESTQNNTVIDNETLLSNEKDVLILAAIDNVITGKNVKNIQAKIIIEGANGPVSPDSEDYLHSKGVISQPDILSNSGGVIVSYFEWVQNIQCYPWSEAHVISELEKILKESFNKVWDLSKEKNISLKESAYQISLKRIDSALTFTKR